MQQKSMASKGEVKMSVEITKENQDKYNMVLEAIRESGAVNIYDSEFSSTLFGAPRWLEEEYGLSRAEARQVFKNWTATYD